MMTPPALHLCQTVAYAHLAQLIPTVPDPGPSPVKSALLDQMLPAVHLIAVVSAFDLGLEEFINSNDVAWPAKTKHDLYNRIKVLGERFPNLNAERLQEVRTQRNKVAHIDRDTELGFVTWSMLTDAIDHMLDAFLVLGYFCAKPSFERSYERNTELFPGELGPEGERIRFTHCFRILLNGEPFLETGIGVQYLPP